MVYTEEQDPHMQYLDAHPDVTVTGSWVPKAQKEE
jgi:hypothetical protein